MERSTIEALTIALCCLLMICVAIFIILMVVKHQHKRLIYQSKIKAFQHETEHAIFNKEMETEHRERERIFRNLHDQVNPMIRAVVRNLEYYKKGFEEKDFVRNINNDVDLLLTALNDIGSCIHELVPLYLIEFGLAAALKTASATLTRNLNIRIEFSNNCESTSLSSLDQNKLINTYRVTVTLMENIIKHSGCKKLCITLSQSLKHIHIHMTHDGIGISNIEAKECSQKEGAVGLKSSMVRANLINATINYNKSETASTIEIKLPK